MLKTLRLKYLLSFVVREKETDEKLNQLRVALQKLPTENYNNLRYSVHHHEDISSHT